ncbi:uncharacterized protein METZ01_LOCUS98741 [marine metagenome]|uniref:Uncharacterized protein n=1 Tax=marine metagenome TaxID=408172 RepID=A0A381W1W5_9ZZZZ
MAEKKVTGTSTKGLSTIVAEGPNDILQWNLLPQNNFSGPFIPFPISNLDELEEWQYMNLNNAEIIEE